SQLIRRTADALHAQSNVVINMIMSGERYVLGEHRPVQAASEYLSLPAHSGTHLDGLAHVFWNGRTYNGRPSSVVTTSRGATWEGMDAVRPGIITRGVLFDIPRL